MAWGGPEEQQEEIAKGNLKANDWHAEARKVIETAVSLQIFLFLFSLSSVTDGVLLYLSFHTGSFR